MDDRADLQDKDVSYCWKRSLKLNFHKGNHIWIQFKKKKSKADNDGRLTIMQLSSFLNQSFFFFLAEVSVSQEENTCINC